MSNKNFVYFVQRIEAEGEENARNRDALSFEAKRIVLGATGQQVDFLDGKIVTCHVCSNGRAASVHPDAALCCSKAIRVGGSLEEH